MIRKLRAKLVLIEMFIFMLMLTVILGMVYFFTRTNLENDSMRMMRSVPNMNEEALRPESTPEEVRLPFFAIYLSEDGELVAAGSYYNLSNEEFLQTLYEEVSCSESESGKLKEYNLRYHVQHSPEGDIYVFADISSEQHTLGSLVRTIIIIWFSSAVVFFFVSVLLARWATKPIEKAFAQQKQFISDASHELKTPLTVIMTNAQMLGLDDFTLEQKNGFVRNITKMSALMKSLVENMLSLTRAENTERLILSDINMSETVEDAVLPFEPVFYEKNLVLTEEIEPGIHIKADARQIQQLVEIFLDNAQKYCRPETETVIKLFRQNTSVILSVSDHGDEISPDEIEKIFMRFYRADKARAINGSYGLGLSIAQQIAENHKAKIKVESSGGINTFSVRF